MNNEDNVKSGLKKNARKPQEKEITAFEEKESSQKPTSSVSYPSLYYVPKGNIKTGAKPGNDTLYYKLGYLSCSIMD